MADSERILALAAQAIENPQAMGELLADLASENQAGDRRADSFQAVLWLCGTHPEHVFRYWDYWLAMLTGNNSFAIFNAIHILTALADFDAEGRIDRILPELVKLLKHRTMMVAANTALCCGRIIKAKSYLDQEITPKLLETSESITDLDKQQMMIRHVIQAFCEYFPVSSQRSEMLKFAQTHLNSTEAKTRALAAEFCKVLETAS